MVIIRNILLATLFIMLLANGYTLIQEDKSFNININKLEVFDDEQEIDNSLNDIKKLTEHKSDRKIENNPFYVAEKITESAVVIESMPKPVDDIVVMGIVEDAQGSRSMIKINGKIELYKEGDTAENRIKIKKILKDKVIFIIDGVIKEIGI